MLIIIYCGSVIIIIQEVKYIYFRVRHVATLLTTKYINKKGKAGSCVC
jgi:hypothetical protein